MDQLPIDVLAIVVNGRNFRHLRETCKNLRVVLAELAYRIAPNHVSAVASSPFTTVVEMSLLQCSLKDSDMQALTTFPQLAHLAIACQRLSRRGVQALSHLNTLQSLELHSPSELPQPLDKCLILPLTSLTSLRITKCPDTLTLSPTCPCYLVMTQMLLTPPTVTLLTVVQSFPSTKHQTMYPWLSPLLNLHQCTHPCLRPLLNLQLILLRKWHPLLVLHLFQLIPVRVQPFEQAE
ncbi:hypothetical protein CEUSTIGMA_g12596.t1 [Chlamydomonas eustigma]|uniref:Uncharacterized protein n=1 Tax=Chlamydomonas eustigma TaxID=1157962 RepID=A0A250XQ33_9CHLO|nr:hypothetical protein CEUSTIGMA_g12596.t1 [Chlamydomonas eustigma]|eukprot:GAX85178.1 hypothetical protein CEUSTIGMA_g12596.t1 [Chlamydomonas eustigma]